MSRTRESRELLPFGSETSVEKEDLEVGVGMGIVLEAEKEDGGMVNLVSLTGS